MTCADYLMIAVPYLLGTDIVDRCNRAHMPFMTAPRSLLALLAIPARDGSSDRARQQHVAQ